MVSKLDEKFADERKAASDKPEGVREEKKQLPGIYKDNVKVVDIEEEEMTTRCNSRTRYSPLWKVCLWTVRWRSVMLRR